MLLVPMKSSVDNLGSKLTLSDCLLRSVKASSQNSRGNTTTVTTEGNILATTVIVTNE